MHLTRQLWFGLGLLMVALGLIGALLPVMPTTIFLILALACFGRSSPALEARLLAHPRYGRSLRAWREQRAITLRGKRWATTGIIVGIASFWLLARPSPFVGMPVSVVMLACAGWLLALPLPRDERSGPLAGWVLSHPRTIAGGVSMGAHVLLLWLALGGWPPAMPLQLPIQKTERIQLTLLPPAAPAVPVAPQQAPQPTPESKPQASPRRQAAPEPLIDLQVAQAVATAPHLPLSPPGDPRAETRSSIDDMSGVETAPSLAAAPPTPSLPPGAELAGAGDPNWEGEVLARLEKFRRYPRPARVRRQQGVVHVRARVDRLGQVLSAQIQRSSGYPVLDQEALDTFQRAQPLPPPPETLADPVELDVPVEFFLR